MRELGVLLVYAAPIGLTLVAFIDAVRWDSWVWALAGRRRVLWMGIIALGLMSVPIGLAISGYYLLWIRRQLRAVEAGDIVAPDPSA